MKGGQRNPKIVEQGKATRFTRGSERAKDAARAATKARVKNINLQKLAMKIATSQPSMTDTMIAQLRDQLGFDMEDDEMMTNAAVLLVKVFQAGLGGDLDAIQQFFQMAGQMTDSRSQNDAARLRLEEKRIDLERERLALERARLDMDAGMNRQSESVRIIRAEDGGIEMEAQQDEQ